MIIYFNMLHPLLKYRILCNASKLSKYSLIGVLVTKSLYHNILYLYNLTYKISHILYYILTLKAILKKYILLVVYLDDILITGEDFQGISDLR